MFLMGWAVNADNKGHFGKLINYAERGFDEEWLQGVLIPVSPFSFETFQKYWLVHFPKLKIGKPSYDTCALCFKYTYTLSAITRADILAKLTLDEITFSDEENGEKDNGEDDIFSGEDGVDNNLLDLSRTIAPEEEEEKEDTMSAEEEEGSIEIQTSES